MIGHSLWLYIEPDIEVTMHSDKDKGLAVASQSFVSQDLCAIRSLFYCSSCPSCIRDLDGVFLYTNDVFHKRFCRNASRNISISDLNMPLETKIHLSKLEMSCSGGSGLRSITSNVKSKENLWLVRIERLSIECQDLYIWQFSENYFVPDDFCSGRHVILTRIEDVVSSDLYLTPRELEIFVLIIAGFTKKYISNILGISHGTVVNHWKSESSKVYRVFGGQDMFFVNFINSNLVDWLYDFARRIIRQCQIT